MEQKYGFELFISTAKFDLIKNKNEQCYIHRKELSFISDFYYTVCPVRCSIDRTNFILALECLFVCFIWLISIMRRDRIFYSSRYMKSILLKYKLLSIESSTKETKIYLVLWFLWCNESVIAKHFPLCLLAYEAFNTSETEQHADDQLLPSLTACDIRVLDGNGSLPSNAHNSTKIINCLRNQSWLETF